MFGKFMPNCPGDVWDKLFGISLVGHCRDISLKRDALDTTTMSTVMVLFTKNKTSFDYGGSFETLKLSVFTNC